MSSRRAGSSAARSPIPWMLLAAALAGGCGGGAAAPPAPPSPGAIPPGATPPATLSREEALAVFDSAWSRVLHAYYDTTFHGLDWDAIGKEYRPQAAGAPSADSLRRVIQTMVDRLGDSHFVVIPAAAADALDPDSALDRPGERGDVGLETRVVDGRIVVYRVEPGLPGEAAGVRPGWLVEAIDTLSAAALLSFLEPMSSAPERRVAEARVSAAADARLAGHLGDTVVARFVDGDGHPATAGLVPVPMRGTPVRFGNLPTMFASLSSGEVPIGDDCAGVIRFNVWMTAILPDFDAAVRSLRHCRGFVLDLRGNPGGMAAMAMAVSGYFMDEREELGLMTTRQGQLHIVSMPRRVTVTGEAMRPFDGPLALLVDGKTMSTSEIFSAGVQELGRARVFGDTTGGQALPAVLIRLPNRDVLMHPIANFVGPDGQRVEGRGVVPDVVAPLTRADLLAGRDAALEAALHWIRNAGTKEPAATGGRVDTNGGTP